MPINFPDSPAENDSFTSGGKKWIFNGSTWNLITANSYTISTGEVTTDKIATGAVHEVKLASGAVTTDKIAAGAVTAAKLGNDISLTPADGSITQAKLASTLSGITICTSSTKPASPFTGQTIFETDTNRQKVWLGSAWSTGVTHSTTLTVEYLVIAGGGGGGAHVAGGGGAGGYRSSVAGESSGANSPTESALILSPGTYAVTIGAGGSRAYNNGAYAYTGDDAGTNGNTSSFSTISSVGGGRGGSWDKRAATNGGCGGGRGGSSGGSPGTGTVGQGFSAVVLTDYGSYQETGGAGAGGANTAGGTGGVGIASAITGTSIFRAGGGGAGSHDNFTRSPGGNGGGGLGSVSNANNAVAGTANTGGGGGGGGGNGGVVSFGANGGSGVVICRYLTANATSFNIVGGTVTNAGSYTIHTFASSGSLVIT